MIPTKKGNTKSNMATPPHGKLGKYRIQASSIGISQGAKSYEPIVSGSFWVSDTIKCPTTGNISYLLTVIPPSRTATQIRVPAPSIFKKDWQIQLANLGIIFLKEGKIAEEYLSASADYCVQSSNHRDLTLIDKTGWFPDNKGYHTGTHGIFAAGVNQYDYWVEPIKGAPLCSCGTTKMWHKEVGRYIEANKLFLGAACIAILSLLLRQRSLNSMLFNFYGLKGCGKTLMAQAAASLFGCGVDPAQGSSGGVRPYVKKFSTTLNGLEPLLATFSPAPVMLDEMTEQSKFNAIFYKIGSGSGKHRATSNLEAAQQVEWLLNIIATSEISTSAAALAAGHALRGGEQDRAIDIPVPSTTLDNFLDFDSFQDLTRHLKQACGQYYGQPAQDIIQYILDHPQEVAVHFQSLGRVINHQRSCLNAAGKRPDEEA